MEWLDKALKDTDGGREIGKLIKDNINKDYVLKNHEIERGDNGLGMEKRVMELEKAEKEYIKEIEVLKEEILKQKIDFEVEKAIILAKGRNVKSIKALVDMKKVFIDRDGNVKGFDLEGIKKSDPYLFESGEKSLKGTGAGFGNKETSDSIRREFEGALFKR